MVSALIKNNSDSIRKKLLTLIIGVTAFALIMANIIEITFDYLSVRSDTQAHMEEIIKKTSKTISLFRQDNHPEDIDTFFAALEFDPYIDKVCYYDENNILTKSFISPIYKPHDHGFNANCSANKNDELLESTFFHVHQSHKVNATNQYYGELILSYDTGRDIIYFIRKEIIAIITIVIGLFFAYILAIRLQRPLLSPIFHLAGLATTLAEKQDFTLRAKKKSHDELGLLVDSFNEMIEGIELRDIALRKAKEEADEANKAKSSFLAMMSHEIRTPMNGIMGMTDLLLETNLTKKQKNYVNIVNSSAQTLLELINDILDVSKIESGKLELEHKAFDITDEIKQVVDLLTGTVEQKGLKLRSNSLLEERTWVIGDPSRIRQIIINLVGNAVKFTETGSITITLADGGDHTTNNDTSIKQVWISVEDTGIGIPENRQQAIFESFAQADTSTTREYGGTGLGLSICERLVELMGGTIGVKSTVGKGSTFWFSIPLESTVSPDELSDDLTNSQTPLVLHSDNKKIMLVEDNKTNIVITEEILSQLDLEITTCGNGQIAYETYKSHPLPLILMDCQMPVMDGFEATKKIRAFEQENNLPRAYIIALTANAMEGDRDRCIAAGMNDYLPKPFRKKQLVDKMNQVTKKA